MQEIPGTPLPKPEADPGKNECIGQMMSSAANRELKVEPEFRNLSPIEELQFLRSRVQQLEREKAEVETENRRLKDMLVNEIPSLLSTMKRNLFPGTGGVSDYEFMPSVSPGTERIDVTLPPQSASVRSAGLDSTESVQSVSTGNDFMHVVSAGCHFPPASSDSSRLCPEMVIDEDCHTCPSSACSSPGLALPQECPEMDHLHAMGPNSIRVRQMEVYPGSSVFCEVRAWHSAMQTQSPTAMARTLLLGVFDMDTLLHSNLRGGRSRRPTFPNHRAGLDPQKLDAIYNATLARFPLARKGQIGTGINSKLSEIRFRSRRANRETRYM